MGSTCGLWRLLFDDQGLWNHLLHMLSVQTTDWMNTGASFYVLVISYIWRNLGYDVVLWMAGLSAIPAALYEAAKVDLLVFKVIDLKIPLTYIGSFAVFVILYMLGTGKGFDVNYLFSHIFGGGLMLGAWFMANFRRTWILWKADFWSH